MQKTKKRHMGMTLFVGLLLMIPVTGLAQDLIFSYPFSGSAVDVSGNGHHGSVSGAVLTEDAFGFPDQAYYFGGGDLISVPDHPDFTLGSSDFTLATRLKISASGGFSYYVMGHDEGPGTTRKWILWIYTTAIGLHVNGPSTGGFWITNHAWTAITNTWFHCAVRRSGNTFTIFVNGQPIGSNTDSRSMPDPNTTFTMGDAESQHPERDFRGSLDDVRLYRVALSDEEIEDLVDEGPVAVKTESWGGVKALFR